MKYFLKILFLVPIYTFGQNFEEKELIILQEKEGFEISGTLTIPQNNPDFKIGIMITGSGQTDRDETIGKHKIFRDLAHKLADHGIATFRYDDRGGYKSKGPKVQNSTADQLAADAISIFNYMHKNYPGHKTGFIGHSEGGGLAAMASVLAPKTSFVVSLAGIARNGMDVLVQQNYDIFVKSKLPEKDVNAYLDQFFKPVLNFVTAEPDSLKKLNFILETGKKFREQNPDAALALRSNTSEKMAPMFQKQLDNPWFISFLKSNPMDYWKKIKCKTMALNGSLDVQVSPINDLGAIEKLNNKHITCKVLEKHNHLFQVAETGSLAEYYTIKESVSEETIKVVSEFLNSF